MKEAFIERNVAIIRQVNGSSRSIFVTSLMHNASCIISSRCNFVLNFHSIHVEDLKTNFLRIY